MAQKANRNPMKLARRITLGFSALFIALALLAFVLPVSADGVPPEELVDDPAGRFITVQGLDIYVEDKGEGTAGTLLMLHGLFGSTESWRYNVDGLTAAGYRVVAFDRPAFGLSDKPADFDYSVSNQADLTVQLMDELGLESAIVLGHSAGGNVAAHVAVQHPQRVEQLVLVDAAVLAGGPPPFVGSLVRLPSVWRWGRFILQQGFTRERLEESLRGFYVDDSWWTEADTDAYWRAFQTEGWDVALLALTRDASPLLSDEAIRGITADTLILWGDSDTITPLEQGEELAALIPNSTLVVLPNTGHQPFEEAPEAFNEALLDYLSEM